MGKNTFTTLSYSTYCAQTLGSHNLKLLSSRGQFLSEGKAETFAYTVVALIFHVGAKNCSKNWPQSCANVFVLNKFV
jgi:hypothetical protein